MLVASGWIIAFLAGVVAALFAAKVWGQWSVRRRPHQLAWGAGLTMYALAALLDSYVGWHGGWDAISYRVFFALAAGNVGFLGLGTVLLARTGRAAQAFAAFVVIGFAVAAVGQLSVPLSADQLVGGCGDAGSDVPCKRLDEWGTDLGAKAIPFSSPARWAFLLLNVVGGLALIGGALLSWWRTRAAGVLLIGVGALLPFLAGSLSTIFGLDLRVVMQFLGIIVMFVGYLRGRETLPPSGVPSPTDG